MLRMAAEDIDPQSQRCIRCKRERERSNERQSTRSRMDTRMREPREGSPLSEGSITELNRNESGVAYLYALSASV